MNRFSLSVSAAIARLTESALGPYQSAVVRIGFSATWLLFLLREFPHRQELYGPDGPWDWELARQLIDSNGSFTVLMWSDGQVWFEVRLTLADGSSVPLWGRATDDDFPFFRITEYDESNIRAAVTWLSSTLRVALGLDGRVT